MGVSLAGEEEDEEYYSHDGGEAHPSPLHDRHCVLANIAANKAQPSGTSGPAAAGQPRRLCYYARPGYTDFYSVEEENLCPHGADSNAVLTQTKCYQACSTVF